MKAKAPKAPKAARKRKMGRPTKYRPEFCDRLVEHMTRGMSFESFGAEKGVECSKETLYTWLKKHKDFLDARKRGMPHLEAFYLKVGHSIMTGQLRRVSAEEPMLDARGAPLRDPATGAILMRKEYAPAHPNAAVWIFACKNMLGWSDKREINHGGQKDNPVVTKQQDISMEQKRQELARLSAARRACEERQA